ncbi:MAG: hypothetical protein KBA52_06515 [Candidatus Kapabacteria bacterium]|nr:hypothetical protein [Candidatus Kapabacteria bacterium]
MTPCHSEHSEESIPEEWILHFVQNDREPQSRMIVPLYVATPSWCRIITSRNAYASYFNTF